MDASKCQLYHIFIFCLSYLPVVGVCAVNDWKHRASYSVSVFLFVSVSYFCESFLKTFILSLCLRETTNSMLLDDSRALLITVTFTSSHTVCI